MADFQQSVNIMPAKAVEGDFATVNPRANAPHADNGYVAGDDGVTIGRFCWRKDNAKVDIKGTGEVLGFITRKGNTGIIFDIRSKGTLDIPAGTNITVHVTGDYWAKFADGAQIGKKVFASTVDGTAVAGEAGTTIANHVETKFTVRSNAGAGGLAIISTY